MSSTETYTRKVIADSCGLPIGAILEVWKDGRKQGSFFTQYTTARRGDCVNLGINGRYLWNVNGFRQV